MEKSKGIISGISINSWVFGVFLLFGISCSLAIITGSTKTAFLLSLPALTCLTSALSEESKVRLLALSIPLSMAQIPRLPLPYGTSISEVILVGLLIDDIMFSHGDHRLIVKRIKPAAIVLLGLFSFAGYIANLRGGNLYTWNTYCLTPLIVFYLISRKLRCPEDAWLFVRFSLLTIFAFLLIVRCAIWTGHYLVYDPLGTEEVVSTNYRIADGMIIRLGPIQQILFATRFGAIAALGLPACIILFIRKQGHDWSKARLLLILAALGYSIILSATRGSFVAAIIGSFLAILVSGRFPLRMLLSVAISIFILGLCGDAFLHLFPAENIQRLYTLSQGVHEIANYQQRMDVLAFCWDLTLTNPLGVGFGYLYHNLQMDDAIIYAVILQGTGVLGAIAFVLFVCHLTVQFVQAALKSHLGSVRDLASVGLSTLAAALLAGVSSQSVLFEPVHAYVFWMLMAVCYYTVAYFPASSEP
jgi:hypothetical protein